MESVPVTVGLDYSEEAIRVCVLNGEGRQLVNRDVEKARNPTGGERKSRPPPSNGELNRRSSGKNVAQARITESTARV